MRFECQESCGGHCCKVKGGFVFLTYDDAAKLEKHTGLPRRSFSQVGVFTSTRFSNKPISARFMDGCRFLENGKCTVYEARPVQCRTFPYWPENVASPEKWYGLAAECPGIGKGTEPDGVDLLATLAAQRRADGEY